MTSLLHDRSFICISKSSTKLADEQRTFKLWWHHLLEWQSFGPIFISFLILYSLHLWKHKAPCIFKRNHVLSFSKNISRTLTHTPYVSVINFLKLLPHFQLKPNAVAILNKYSATNETFHCWIWFYNLLLLQEANDRFQLFLHLKSGDLSVPCRFPMGHNWYWSRTKTFHIQDDNWKRWCNGGTLWDPWLWYRKRQDHELKC